MSTDDTSGVGVAAWAALQRAAQETAAAWQAQRQTPASPAPSYDALSLWLVGTVRAALGNRPLDAPAALADVPRTRLLELLRRQFTRQARLIDAASSMTGVLRLMSAIDSSLEFIESAPADRSPAGQGRSAIEQVVEMAHDIRSPLTSILFLVDTLRRGSSGPLTAVQERQLGLIYSAAFGLSALAEDVIEMARGGDRLVEGAPIPFSVSEIVYAVRDIVLPIAEEKGMGISLETPARDYRLGYPLALSRVLLNLVANALKYSDEGRVTLSIREVDALRVECSVHDSGPGLPPAVVDAVTTPLRPGTISRAERFSSSGLGLAICRTLLAAMDSDLRVESGRSCGSRLYFVVQLPPMTRE